MNKKKAAKLIIQIALFTVALVVTFSFIQNSNKKVRPSSAQQGSSEDQPGLSVGELVALPPLPRLTGDTVALGNSSEKYILCGFFSTSCPGCSKDSEFWQSLSVEAAKRGVAFYLIGLDQDPVRVNRFAKAYGFENLPVLFDPNNNATDKFKISLVPQYVLLASNGTVLGRWSGLSHSDADHHRIELPAQFLENLPGP